jgi:hypothetical protein
MPPNGAISVEMIPCCADDAVFEGLGDALDAADVAAEEIKVREAEFGVVGHLVGVRRRSCRRGRRTTSRGPFGTVW